MRYVVGCTVGLLVASSGFAAAQNPYVMDRDEEIRLAMSAGPLELSKNADVYVFGAEGFEQVLEGTNGYSCLVIRQAGDPAILAPHCLSPDATESVLPAKLREGALIARGLDGLGVRATLQEEFESGALPIPSGQAFAFMMSSGQHLGAVGQFRPHFMLYLPYATSEDIGGSFDNLAFPFAGPGAGQPHSTMVIVMEEFVDPQDVERRW